MKLLAFDYGASSGRAILGEFDGAKLSLSELHRFSSDPVMMNGTFTWDFPRLFFELKKGILKAYNAGHKEIASLGIDTGVWISGCFLNRESCSEIRCITVTLVQTE